MLFDETVKWGCLIRFFQEPEREFYVKELTRELKISSGSASVVCKQLMKEGLLESYEKGRALFYRLKNSEPLVKRLKSAWFLEQLKEITRDWDVEGIYAIALYGSRASGEFISKSDVDIFVMTNLDKTAIRKHLHAPEIVNIHIFSPAEWRKLAQRKDKFYIEVIANHVPIYGTSLVVG